MNLPNRREGINNANTYKVFGGQVSTVKISLSCWYFKLFRQKNEFALVSFGTQGNFRSEMSLVMTLFSIPVGNLLITLFFCPPNTLPAVFVCCCNLQHIPSMYCCLHKPSGNQMSTSFFFYPFPVILSKKQVLPQNKLFWVCATKIKLSSKQLCNAFPHKCFD